MTRFRAYFTDSDSDSDEEDVVQQQLHPRRSQLLDSDQDSNSDEEQPLNEENEEKEERAEGARPPPTQPRVHPQKMHLMQAALFRQPEEEAILNEMNKEQKQQSVKSLYITGPRRKHSRDSDGDPRRESVPRTSFAHDLAPAFRPTRKFARVAPSAVSITQNAESAIIDAGLSFGRSFRVGWGAGGLLVRIGGGSGEPQSPTGSNASTSLVTLSRVPLATSTHHSDTAQTLSQALLQHNLSHTSITSSLINNNSQHEHENEVIPTALPSERLTFASYAALPVFSPEEGLSTGGKGNAVWKLGRALFDPISLRLRPPASQNLTLLAHAEELRRKKAIGRWLMAHVSSLVEAELRKVQSEAKPDDNDTWAKEVWTLLTGNQVQRAVDRALESGNPYLASLIAQVGGDETFRADIHAQLDIWRDEKADAYISPSIIKIYALLAGITDSVEVSSGKKVKVMEGLDWYRAFGVQLWFGEKVDEEVGVSVESYEELVEKGVAPSPVTSGASSGGSEDESDILWTLLKMYADSEMGLEDALTPARTPRKNGDGWALALSWFLYVALGRARSVRDFGDREAASFGGRRIQRRSEDVEVEGDDNGGRKKEAGEEGDSDEDVPVGHSSAADRLTAEYAAELEEAGMVQEGVFVLEHLEGAAGRKRAIKDVLTRNADKLDEWMVRGLVGSLKVPLSWIEEARATYLLYSGKLYDAYGAYLAASMYREAHDIAVRDLLASAVVRGDLELVSDLLEPIRRVVSSSTSVSEKGAIDGWTLGGKVFLDYVHVIERLPVLKANLLDKEGGRAVPDASELGEMEELVRSVGRLVGVIPDTLHVQEHTREGAVVFISGDGDDVRKAAADVMIGGLVKAVGDIRPLAIGASTLKTARVQESVKLRHMRQVAYERFLRTIEVAS